MTTPAPTHRTLRERIGQTVGLLLFGLLVLRQFSLFPAGEPPTDLIRWGLVTAFFLLACSAYVSRRPARVLARGPLDTVLPLVCAALPLIQSDVPSVWVTAVAGWIEPLGITTRQLWWPISREYVGIGLLLAALGEAITVTGLLSLRRSFSIFTEARELVTHGLYRFVRHPLYMGEMLTVLGFLIAWPSGWSAAVTIVFMTLQSWRAKREEALLTQTFDEYADYRARTGFVWPWFSSRRSGSAEGASRGE